LAAQSEEMGAQHKFDLTSEVTHLIVGDYDTPKYRYIAKARPDVKIMMLSWINAVRELWIHDLPIDMSDLEKAHTLPTFSSLKICMTGFEDRELCNTSRYNEPVSLTLSSIR
jgi:DNA replication regulator DPB11